MFGKCIGVWDGEGKLYNQFGGSKKKQAQKFLRLIKETLGFYEYEPLKIADLGTGDGVLSYALKRAYPNAYVLGVDKDIKPSSCKGKL